MASLPTPNISDSTLQSSSTSLGSSNSSPKQDSGNETHHAHQPQVKTEPAEENVGTPAPKKSLIVKLPICFPGAPSTATQGISNNDGASPQPNNKVYRVKKMVASPRPKLRLFVRPRPPVRLCLKTYSFPGTCLRFRSETVPEAIEHPKMALNGELRGKQFIKGLVKLQQKYPEQAENIKELSIAYLHEPAEPLGATLGTLRLPSLTSLELIGVEATWRSVWDFIENHPTLKSVQIRDMHVLTDSYEHTGRRFHGGGTR